jgi:elongation factor Ts
MMDCKKALLENDGDFERAKDWLREKGIAGAAKREGRAADQGAIEVLVRGGVGAVVELNCETDFVAKGSAFGEALSALTQLVVDEGDVELGSKRIGNESVDDYVKGLSGTLGEKIELGRIFRFETTDGLLDGYKHIQNERGTVGVVVELGGVDVNDDKVKSTAHDIALHIASAAPRYVSRDEVPAEEVARERDIYEAQTKEEGKPEQAWPKIIEGKLNGFFKTVALVEQAFVKDNKQTIDAVVKALGPDAHVRGFARVKIGEE